MGNYYVFRGDLLLSIKYGEKCLHGAEKIQDVELIAPFAYDLFTPYQVRGESLKIVNIAPRVLSTIENTKKESEFFGRPFILYPTLCTQYGMHLGMLGNFEEGEIFCEKGLRIATEIGDLGTLGIIEWMYGHFYYARGDGKLAIKHYKKSCKYFEETKIIYLLGAALGGLGFGYYFLGDLEEARKHLEKGIKISKDAGVEFNDTFFNLVLSYVLYDSGDLKSAQKNAEKAMELSQKNNGIGWETWSKLLLGRIIGKANVSQSTEAEDYILKGIKTFEELKLRPFYSQGYLFLGEL